ncbi:hypothetical protein R0J87_15680 [Halomonas sp. SIMBA_159]
MTHVYIPSLHSFSPTTDSEAGDFDYRKVLLLAGARLPQIFTDAVRSLIHRDELIYESPSYREFEIATTEESAFINLSTSTFIPHDIERFEFVTLEMESEAHLPELAFGIRMRDQSLALLSESDCIRIFSNIQQSDPNSEPLSFAKLINDLASRSFHEYRREDKWPVDLPSGVWRFLSMAETPHRLTQYHAIEIGERIMRHNRLPFLLGGKVIEPKPKSIEVPDIPELDRSSAFEEAKKINPNFGALSF